MSNRTQLEAILAQVEEMWGLQDTLFNSLSATDGWDHKHGPDWTFADVPYHLAYFNRDLVIGGLQADPDLPDGERLSFAGVEDVNAWNARKFAERPAGQTAEESVAQLRASWDDLRRLASRMTDADLEGPYWTPFGGGMWLTAREGLGGCVVHDWSEFTQLRIHMGRSEPVPSPDATSAYLGTMIGMGFPMMLDREAADGHRFTTVMAFTDPGVSAYTIRVAEGAATVSPEHAEDADLVMTQSSETFEKTFRGIQDPGEAIQSGAVRVSNFESLATFGQLFPTPA